MKIEMVYIILALSLLINVLFFYFDTIKFVWPKVKNKVDKSKTIKNVDKNTEKLIYSKGLEMLASSKSLMSWNEPKGFTNELLLLKVKHYSLSKEYRLFNYPRAFLYYGLSEFFIKNEKKKELLELKILFDKLFGFEKEEKFKVSRIDQLPFGLTAINLYEEFKESKYLEFSNDLYKYVENSIGNDGIISYREGQEVVFFDTLGMVVPFLIKYNKYNKTQDLLAVAKKQLDYYISYGVDKDSFLPAHGINRKSNIKVGSINWGRGTAWYLIALSSYYKETGAFENEFKGILNSLNLIKNSDDLWNQFPGSYGVFDASATTSFLYSFALKDNASMTKENVLNNLKTYIASDGSILQTSGDTYGPNSYSSLFGKSEFSQGMLLMLLSQLNK